MSTVQRAAASSTTSGSSTVTEAGKRRLLPRAERRAQILDAAASAFAERGFSDTAMEEVAARAGITKLIVYRHFGSKAELYQAVLESVFDRLATEVTDRIPTMVGRGAVPSALMVVAREQPEALRLLMVHSAREPEFDELVKRFDAVAQSVAASVLESTGDDEVDRWQARTLADFVVGGVLRWVEDGDPARDAEVVARLAAGGARLAAGWRERELDESTPHDDAPGVRNRRFPDQRCTSDDPKADER